MRDKDFAHDLQESARQFPELASIFEDLYDAMEQIERLDEEEERSDKAREEEDRKADEARAERARKGELGAEWQRLQRRIDKGETSLTDVFTGKDASADAQALRARAAKNLGTIRERWAREAEAGEHNPLTVARAGLEEQAAHLQRVKEHIESESQSHPNQ